MRLEDGLMARAMRAGERRREGVVAEAAALAEGLPGVRAAAGGGGVRLTGGGVARRWARGEWALAAWIEGVRLVAGTRR